MNEEEVHLLLNQLRENSVNELRISKEDFSVFREVLVKEDDFKHFKGTARRNGHVIFEYLEEPRS